MRITLLSLFINSVVGLYPTIATYAGSFSLFALSLQEKMQKAKEHKVEKTNKLAILVKQGEVSANRNGCFSCHTIHVENGGKKQAGTLVHRT